MEQSPWREANSRSANHENPCILRIYCRVHKSSQSGPHEPSSQPHMLFLSDPFEYYIPLYSLIFRVVSLLQAFQPKFYTLPYPSSIKSQHFQSDCASRMVFELTLPKYDAPHKQQVARY